MTPATPAPGEVIRPGRRRDPRVDTKAIEAVLEIYSQDGLTGLSFDRVARRAAVGKAALYRRWDSIEQLLIDGLRTIAPPPTVADFGSLHRDLRQLTLMVCELYSGSRGRAILRILIDASTTAELRPYYDEFTAAYVLAATEIVERGARRGELPADVDSALLLEQLFGTTMLHVLFFSDPDVPVPLVAASRFADRLVDRLLAGQPGSRSAAG
jgi:AcrR family transcriptional regulator